MNDTSLPTKDENGQYPAYAWPGGYTLIYFDETGNVLCADCASKEDEYSYPTVACGTYDEGPTIQCDGCYCEIESSYGNPWEEEEEEDA